MIDELLVFGMVEVSPRLEVPGGGRYGRGFATENGTGEP
jgi:hypothetical protein